MTGLYVVLALVGVLAIALLVSYNLFVEQRNLVRESWSNIDTELRRRYDLIPNLVRTVEAYAAHEKLLLEQVTQARAQALASTGSPEAQAGDERVLVTALRSLFAVSEGYPDLKASDNFLELQRELVDTEDRIQASRRFYNANVRDLNRRVQSVPSNIVASLFGFHEAEYFEVEPAIRTAGAPTVQGL